MTNDCDTHPDFYDCNCEKNYMHRKDKPCKQCGPYHDEFPDARINELRAAGLLNCVRVEAA